MKARFWLTISGDGENAILWANAELDFAPPREMEVWSEAFGDDNPLPVERSWISLDDDRLLNVELCPINCDGYLDEILSDLKSYGWFDAEQ